MNSFATDFVSKKIEVTNPKFAHWSRSDGQLATQHLQFHSYADSWHEPHAHSEYVAFVCLGGELSLEESGETIVIGPGETVMGNAGRPHTLGCLRRAGQACEFLSVAFDAQLLASLAADFKLPAPVAEVCPAFIGSLANVAVQHCALEITEEFRQRRAGYQQAIESLAMRSLIELLRAWPRPQIKEVSANFVPRLTQRDFMRAYEFMRRCPKETFRLQYLCQFLGFSEERFTRLFLASTGHTPASFYNRLLLERGRDLLRDRALSIKEIGFELGFKTTSHFIASFRREYAATPQGYREQGREFIR